MLKLLSIVAGAAFCFATGAAHATQNIGIVGLYQVDNPQAAVVDAKTVAGLGCSIRHTGIIAAVQGEIGLAKPNQFVFLACDKALLGSSQNRTALREVVKNGKNLAVLEGNLTDFPLADGAGDVPARQYILKVSHYNNKDADKRDAELNQLTEEAGALADTYVTESFIGVNQALGLPTPDEVVILYYNSDEEGGRFRKNNGGLLKKIGKFNQDHLVDAAYYVGKALQ